MSEEAKAEVKEEVVKPKAAPVKTETVAPKVEKPVEKPKVKEPVEEVPDKKPVSFCLLTCNRFTHGFGKGVKIVGQNSIVTINPTDINYDMKVAFMRNDKGNKSKGGTKFVEVDDTKKEEGGTCLLDTLRVLSFESLLDIVEGDDVRDKTLTIGELMTKIMKQKGAL